MYKVWAFWLVPISRSHGLILTSHRWSTSISSSIKGVIEYIPSNLTCHIIIKLIYFIRKRIQSNLSPQTDKVYSVFSQSLYANSNVVVGWSLIFAYAKNALWDIACMSFACHYIVTTEILDYTVTEMTWHTLLP
jgi:hypothetical protein